MQSTALKSSDVPYGLTKSSPNAPAFVVTGRTAIAIAAGVSFLGADLPIVFQVDTPIAFDAEQAQPGADYLVFIDTHGVATAHAVDDESLLDDSGLIGGFHFAPGGNASGTNGGDDVPAINPYSCWDLNWRPACENAAGMTLVDGRFWVDIYLSAAHHRDDGTSRFGETIADGEDCPEKIDDGFYAKFDFETAKAMLAEHGKQLLGAEEFFAMAYGVTERSAAGADPRRTGLDAPRTSRWGIMQATGNMWTWGTDGHPDIPRASLFGGSWLNGSGAGSRYAYLVYWPESSGRDVGARGRSDHMILA